MSATWEDRAGSDVAQLYTHQRVSALVQPIKSLRAFERVSLAAGETKHVHFTIPVDQLGFYDVKTHGMKVEPGVFDVLVGSSSDDIRLKQIVTVPVTHRVAQTAKK